MLASPGELSSWFQVWPGVFTAPLRPAALAKALAVSARGQLAQCQESSRSVLSAMCPVHTREPPPPPPGQFASLSKQRGCKFDCWNLLKTHELTKGKK